MSKSALLVALIAIGLPEASVLASYNGPLISKFFSSGAVSPQYHHSKICNVYADRIETTTYSGAIKTIETRAAQTSRSELLKAIAGAEKGKVTHYSAPVGGSSVTYYAMQTQPDDTVTQVDLGAKAGDSQSLENDAPEAKTLLNLLDLLCN